MLFCESHMGKCQRSILNDINITLKNRQDMNYGKVFKQIREASQTSRPQMARELGITPSALWKIEHCRAAPKRETISRFCNLAGISVAYFYISSLEKEDFML